MDKRLFVFPFEELNSVAFANARIFLEKVESTTDGSKVRFEAIGPDDFVGLFFHADRLLTTGPLLTDYSKIMNHREFKYENWSSQERVLKRVFEFFMFKSSQSKQAALNLLPTSVYFRLPFRIRAHGRVRRFYLQSGYRKNYVLPLRGEYNLVEPGENFAVSTRQKYKPKDLGQLLEGQFKDIQSMITLGGLISDNQLDAALSDALENMSPRQRHEYNSLCEALDSDEYPGGMALLRTRNKSVASIHNANVERLSPILSALSELGIGVINTGAPCKPLGSMVDQDFSHTLPPVAVMSLARKAVLVLTSAEGDFFSGWAQMPFDFIFFDREWSMSLTRPVSLIEARKLAGKRDLHLHDQSKIQNSGVIVEEIKAHLKLKLLDRRRESGN